MQIKSIIAGAAIALAATVGSAYAADQLAVSAPITAQTFGVLGKAPAEPMTANDMARVTGTGGIGCVACDKIFNLVGFINPGTSQVLGGLCNFTK